MATKEKFIEELRRLEASMARYDGGTFEMDEVDPNEYQIILARIVYLRVVIDLLPPEKK